MFIYFSFKYDLIFYSQTSSVRLLMLHVSLKNISFQYDGSFRTQLFFQTFSLITYKCFACKLIIEKILVFWLLKMWQR